MAENKITSRFLVNKNSVTIEVTYQEVRMLIRWDRTPESHRHVRTLIGNLPDIIAEGLNEVFVQDQANRLDYEIEEFFLDNEKDRPDDN